MMRDRSDFFVHFIRAPLYRGFNWHARTGKCIGRRPISARGGASASLLPVGIGGASRKYITINEVVSNLSVAH